MKDENAIEFRDFIRQHDIKGKVVAELLKLHINYIYQMVAGAAKVSNEQLHKLKHGYFELLEKELKELEIEVA